MHKKGNRYIFESFDLIYYAFCIGECMKLSPCGTKANECKGKGFRIS